MTRFEDPNLLQLLWLLPAAALLLALAAVRNRRNLRAFVDRTLAHRMAPGRSAARTSARALLLIAASAAALTALARPQGEPSSVQATKLGRDICIVIDVSKSMLADDLRPNRLDRTRVWIDDLLDSLAGDRVAVIAMAGVPSLASPLTHDYAFARAAIRNLDPNSTPLGGTNLGDPIRLALDEVFPDADNPDAPARSRDILLISDGEETLDSLPVEAAADAGQRGIRIIALGLGSAAGSPVPITDAEGNTVGQLRDRQGRPVVARLDADTLADMANQTPGGVFLNVGTADIQLDTEYAKLAAEADRRELEEAETLIYQEWFQILALLAIAALALEMTINERNR